MSNAPDRDRDSDASVQARGWARVARASAAVYGGSPGPQSNAELFDAVAYAATQARLGIRDLVDAYIAGAPALDMHEAWDDVEGYLERIARVDADSIDSAFASIERALPDWRRQLALRIAAHDLALGAHRVLGGHDERIDVTRRAVWEVLEGARGADASEEELDAYLVELRVKHCDLSQVIIAAAWIAAERARLALQRATPLPRAPWATIAEIAVDRGVSTNVIAAIVDDAVHRGLLARDDDQRVTVTAAGHSHAERSARQ